MSFNRLIEKIVKMKNPTVAGLDPKLEYVPQYIREKYYGQYGKTLEAAAEALYEYNVGLIDALCDIVPAVKPQMAYYEMYGWQGVKTFDRTVKYAQSKGNVCNYRRQAQRYRSHDGIICCRSSRMGRRGWRDDFRIRFGRADRQRLPWHRRNKAAFEGLR